jgi:hypothetical protein
VRAAAGRLAADSFALLTLAVDTRASGAARG